MERGGSKETFYFLIRPSPGVRHVGICCLAGRYFSRFTLCCLEFWLDATLFFFLLCAGSRLTHLVTCTRIRVKRGGNGSLWPSERATNRSTRSVRAAEQAGEKSRLYCLVVTRVWRMPNRMYI